MCDYSLHHISSRSAKVNDQVVTTELARSKALGFAAVGERGAKLVIDEVPPQVVVCLMPGTELSFDEEVRFAGAFGPFGTVRVKHKLARFRQIDLDDPDVQHDALEFPDGRIVKVGRLAAGQTARVLQLPVNAEAHHEHDGPRRAARPSESRLALNRVSAKPGMASILMPSQGAVMLWQACLSATAQLSMGLEQSFRRLKARRQTAIFRTSPAAAHAELIATNAALAEATPRQTSAAPRSRKADRAVA